VTSPALPAFPEALPRPLRGWQTEALKAYRAAASRDWLAVATPGAGKTTFALAIARELLRARVIQQITVVTPTEHLKGQWADAARPWRLSLDPTYRNDQGAAARGTDGVVVTYAQVAAHPRLHRNRTEARRSLVILDEVHHTGDAMSWGDAIREAFDPAVRRLSLTGTPFRSDTSQIPFVSYEPDAEGIRRSRADSTYGYAQALKEGVVRPVLFLGYSGESTWRTSAGDIVSATLGDLTTVDVQARAWRAALDPHGDWIPTVFAAADRRLSQVRASMPDAGGMVIATDQEAARAYARILRDVTGSSPVVALSDDASAGDRIQDYADSTSRWLVAVRMVSEGVDIPRLAVGVYATSASTPLFFAQAVGRFVRSRRPGETASVFLPSVPVLMGLAAQMERVRDHALDRVYSGDGLWSPEDELVREAQASRDVGADQGAFEALGSTATLDRVLMDGTEMGVSAMPGSPEEEEFLGLPGLLSPDQVSTLLTHRRSSLGPVAQVRPGLPSSMADHRERAALRKELNGLVAAWHHRTGETHATVHAELRRVCGGPLVAQADLGQLQERIDRVREWAALRTSRPKG
jgi:superfamily II DNA or RNA helicase